MKGIEMTELFDSLVNLQKDYNSSLLKENSIYEEARTALEALSELQVGKHTEKDQELIIRGIRALQRLLKGRI